MSDNVEIYIWCSVKHHQLLHWQLLDKIQGRLSGNVVSVSTVFLFLFSRVPQNKQRNFLTFLESTGNHDFKTNTTLLSMCYVNKWSSYSTKCETTLILVLHLQLHITHSVHCKMPEEGLINPKYCLSCQKIGGDKTDFIFHN